jgi:hypothetical protein
VPRTFKPMDLGEVLAEHILAFNPKERDERLCAAE